MRGGDALRWQRDGDVLAIRLDRPDALNAINADMLDAFERALTVAEHETSVRAVSITGTGRAFSVGADLRELDEIFVGAPAAFLSRDGFATRLSALLTRIDELPKPIVGGLNGLTVGGGLEIALVCDLVIATTETLVGDGHVNYGLLPSGGASGRLPARLGTSWARRLALTGELVEARDLMACGFIARVVETEELDEAVSATANQLAAKRPLALGRLKELHRLHLQHPLDEVLGREHEVMDRHVADQSMRDGVRRFLSRTSEPSGG